MPARDEADTIGASISTLIAQRYPGDMHVTLVDDASTDGTGVVAQAAAFGSPAQDRLAVVRARPLAAPWTGKLNALDTGVGHVMAARGAPAYWLFTDADIAHDERNVAALVAKAQRDGLDLVSLMVRLRCESAWEELLIPAFVFFFAKLYPFAWSNEPSRATAAAAGGCILLSHAMLDRIGGLRSIAGALIDDCALAAVVKKSGGRTWLGLTDCTTSIRPYTGLESLWTMVKRTAFTQSATRTRASPSRRPASPSCTSSRPSRRASGSRAAMTGSRRPGRSAGARWHSLIRRRCDSIAALRWKRFACPLRPRSTWR